MTKLKTLIIDEKSRAEIIGNDSPSVRRQRELPRDQRPYQRQQIISTTSANDGSANGSPSTLRMLAGRLTAAIQHFLPVKLFSSGSDESISSMATAQLLEAENDKHQGKGAYCS
jgi:hypothetical protein